MYCEQETSVQLGFAQLVYGKSMFLLQIILTTCSGFYFWFTDPQRSAVQYLRWVNKRWRRKPHLLSVGSHLLCKDLLLPWKISGFYKPKRLKAALREVTHSPLSPGNMTSNLKGHPNLNYWICKKLSYPGSQVPLEIQNLNHGLCNTDSSHHLLNAYTSSFLTTIYLQEIKLLQN